MEISNVTFKRYTPSEGKALKIHRKFQDVNGTTSEWLSYSLVSVIAYDEELITPIEEVDVKEFQEWYEKEGRGLCVGTLR